MQYYVDGFRTGDPDIKPTAFDRTNRQSQPGDIPEEVDVLVAGCGPAGLCLRRNWPGLPKSRR